jgi:hypothetical protein
VFRDGRISEWSSARSKGVLKSLSEAIPEKSRVISGVTLGLNPAMKFGYAQDRFPSGSICLVAGVTGVLRGASLRTSGGHLVEGGVLR